MFVFFVLFDVSYVGFVSSPLLVLVWAVSVVFSCLIVVFVVIWLLLLFCLSSFRDGLVVCSVV